MTRVSKLSRARGTDAKTVESKFPGRRIESTASKVLFFKAYVQQGFSLPILPCGAAFLSFFLKYLRSVGSPLCHY